MWFFIQLVQQRLVRKPAAFLVAMYTERTPTSLGTDRGRTAAGGRKQKWPERGITCLPAIYTNVQRQWLGSVDRVGSRLDDFRRDLAPTCSIRFRPV